jgi:hypothetical protein
MIPSGSVDDADMITIDPADTLEYNSEIGEPHWQTAPEVPRWISGEAAQLEAEMDDIFHTHQTTRGEAPGDRNSGLALALLAEKDDTPLGPMAKDQSMGWGRIAEMTLSLYRMNAESSGITRNVMLITERGVPHQVTWNAKDIDEKPIVLVPIDATMPRSKLATQSMITSLAQQFPMVFQNVDARSISKMLDLPDPKLFLSQQNPDMAKAEWENGLLMQGVPIIPEDFDVHDVHINVHNTERKSTAYELADPEVKQLIDAHIMAHVQFMSNEVAATMAQADQEAAGETADPGLMATLQSGAGLPMPQSQMDIEQEMIDMERSAQMAPQDMAMMGEEEMMDPSMMDPTMMGGTPGMEGI